MSTQPPITPDRSGFLLLDDGGGARLWSKTQPQRGRFLECAAAGALRTQPRSGKIFAERTEVGR